MARKPRSNGKRSRKNRKTQKAMQVPEPLLVGIRAAAILLGRSQSGIYRLLANGELAGVKSGKRTLIYMVEIRRYADSLPARTAGEFAGVRNHSANPATA
jgi:excisionase family DNA binding protein